MDRTLKVYASTGHLFAVFQFNYDKLNQAGGFYTEYRRLYRDDEEDEQKSVYESGTSEMYLRYQKFNEIEQIVAHDKGVVKERMGRDMKNPDDYSYVYEEQPILLRYVVENHIGCIGMINVLYSFINNTKEVKFLSATEPRFDFDISSNSLESNLECIMRIPVYTARDIREISPYDLKRLPPWY